MSDDFTCPECGNHWFRSDIARDPWQGQCKTCDFTWERTEDGDRRVGLLPPSERAGLDRVAELERAVLESVHRISIDALKCWDRHTATNTGIVAFARAALALRAAKGTKP